MKQDPYDAVFLLGGGTSSRLDGISQLSGSGDRVALAARLFHAGKIQRIICTGTHATRTTEKDLHPGEEAANILEDLQVPPDRIAQMKGENTSQEIRNIRLWLDKNPNPGRVGILSSAWHLPRVMRLAEANGVIADPIPADFLSRPFAPNPSLLIPSAGNLDVTARIVKEILAGWVSR